MTTRSWLAALTSTLGLVATLLPAQSPLQWRREPDMPTPRAAHAVVATADTLYALAGTGPDGKPVLDVERFDGKAWDRVSAIPGEGLNAPAAAVVGDSIFLIGGFGATSNRPTTAVRRYDTKGRMWTDMAPLPAPRGGHAAVVLGGRIHVIGGGNSTSTISDHSIYDPSVNRWTEAAALPRSLGSPAAVVVGNRLYSIAGRSGPNDFGEVYIYDSATDLWTLGVPLAPRGTGGAAVLGTSIYYIGGESQATATVLDDVWRLDLRASRWVLDARLPTARNFARSVVFHGRIYVVGGSTTYGLSHASPGSNVVESLGR